MQYYIKHTYNPLQYILPTISRTKDNQAMKLGQLIEYNIKNIFLQKSLRKWGVETSSKPLFVFFEIYLRSKQVVSTLVSTNLVDLHLDICWFRDMLNYYFLLKDLRQASPQHFVYNYLRKIFFILYSINRSNFIASLLLFTVILGNMCIIIICFPVCNVINFEITLSGTKI